MTIRYNTAAGYAPVPRPKVTITPAYVQIWSPKSIHAVLAVLLDPSFIALPCHYWQKRTRPCTRPKGHCEACEAGMAPRLAAWIAAELRANRQRVVIQITAGALAHCSELWEWDGRLLGRGILCSRAHEAPQAPMVVQLLPKTSYPDLPAYIETRKVLASVWGYSQELIVELQQQPLPPGLDFPRKVNDNTPQ